MSRRIRQVRTASGAVAVQVITRRGDVVVSIEHVGSSHDDASLELLLEVARERLNPGQEAFDLGDLGRVAARVDAIADWTRPALPVAAPVVAAPAGPGRPRHGVGGAETVGTRAQVLWDTMGDAYTHLGFDVLADPAFRAMVLARIIEPASKADTIRVLRSLGVTPPGLNTLYRALGRCIQRDYRGQIAKACLAHSARTAGYSALVMYDATTLHMENEDEDDLRRVGMSKEHRVDPQVQVGLLVDPAGFPLEVHLFEGNRAETTTIVPVLQAFQGRHGVRDMVVVADAGMLSAGNLNALEDAGFSFIVGSRMAKAPYDLAEHFSRHGDAFTDGQIIESARVMGAGKNARSRRVVYQWRFKRHKRDERTINLQIERAEKIASGATPPRNARFLKVTGAKRILNEETIARARQLAGIKGYVTNVEAAVMDGAGVIAAYHHLWQVEASFRITKHDLRARPVFHHKREAIEAHLTVVLAALAISRYLTAATGASIKKIVQTLRDERTSIIETNGTTTTIPPRLTPEATRLLNALNGTKPTG
ncbi:IS1634 family transposase [Salana multivorans]